MDKPTTKIDSLPFGNLKNAMKYHYERIVIKPIEDTEYIEYPKYNPPYERKTQNNIRM